MYCKNCGKQIADDSNFCRFCGNGVLGSSWQEPLVPTHSPTIKKNIEQQNRCVTPKKGNRLVALFLWSVVVCICCTLGYAAVRYEDSKPCDNEHYWGSSVYDPGMLFGGVDYQNVVTDIRKDKYKAGIKKMAIYSFPISLGILVIGAILTGTMNNNNNPNN